MLKGAAAAKQTHSSCAYVSRSTFVSSRDSNFKTVNPLPLTSVERATHRADERRTVPTCLLKVLTIGAISVTCGIGCTPYDLNRSQSFRFDAPIRLNAIQSTEPSLKSQQAGDQELGPDISLPGAGDPAEEVVDDWSEAEGDSQYVGPDFDFPAHTEEQAASERIATSERLAALLASHSQDEEISIRTAGHETANHKGAETAPQGDAPYAGADFEAPTQEHAASVQSATGERLAALLASRRQDEERSVRTAD